MREEALIILSGAISTANRATIHSKDGFSKLMSDSDLAKGSLLVVREKAACSLLNDLQESSEHFNNSIITVYVDWLLFLTIWTRDGKPS